MARTQPIEPASTPTPASPIPARKSAARILRTRRTVAPELTGTGYLSVGAPDGPRPP